MMSRVALLVGAVGSLGLMLYAGRSNTHVLITAGFIFWVLAPFVLLALAERRSETWAPKTRAALNILTTLVVVGSLAIYAYRAVKPPSTTGAFLFVLVPPVSVVLVLVTLGIVSVMSRPSQKESL
jgi:membrane-bound metal-dependent hydrolase YbcI (DUF457 family)